jgi:putative redox protein
VAEQNVTLWWEGEGLRFRGGADGGPEVAVDGDGKAGASPMQQLLLALASCMAADMVDIMNKSRTPLAALEVRVEGDRAPEPPRRYTAIRMHFAAAGVSDADAGKLERALELSRTTYCSVLHTLRPDAEVTFELERR